MSGGRDRVRIERTGTGLKRLNERLAEAARGRGASAFMDECCKTVRDGNRADRLDGVDRHGREMPTPKPRPGRGPGPYLVPEGPNSRAIKLFSATWTRLARGRQMSAGWGAGASFLKYFPRARGVSPRTWARLRTAFRDHAAGVFRQIKRG